VLMSGRTGSLPTRPRARALPNSAAMDGRDGGSGGLQVADFLASGTPRGGLKPGGNQVDLDASALGGEALGTGGLDAGGGDARGAGLPPDFLARSGRIGILPTSRRFFLPPNSREGVGRGGGFGGL
jgi:hypothetical protein